MEDEHLPIALCACTNTNSWDGYFTGDQGGECVRNTLKHQSKDARLRQCFCVRQECACSFLVFSLDAIPAHRFDRLRCQSQVSHDWNFSVQDGLDHGEALAATF